MSELIEEQSVDRNAFEVVPLSEEGDDRAYWQAKAPAERLKLLRETLSILFFAVVTVMMGAYAHDKRLSGEVSMNLGLPEYLLLYALCACFAVGTLTMLVDFAVFLRHGSKS